MNSARILIVEDERLVARDIHSQLSASHYRIVGVAASGEDAVAMAKAERPDLVLMDVHLEGTMDGVSAARAIREQMDVPIVYLTAFADDETLARARITEPHGYVLKPFAEPELRSVIEMALYKHAAERKLRLSEKRFHVTLSSIGDAVIATNEHGAVTFMNAAAEVLTGTTLGGARGVDLAATFRLRSERGDHQAAEAVAAALRAGASVTIPSDVELVRPDGSHIPIDATSAPIRDDAGSILGVVLVFHDASTRRLSEERYRQSQKMEAIGLLAGGVAHDFNNLLTVIGCYCALSRAALPDGHAVRGFVDRSERRGVAGGGAHRRQLLALGRKQLLEPRIVDLNRILKDAEPMLRRVLGEDIAFHVALHPTLGHVRVDPRQIDQVVVNLALNARDAMPTGGAFHVDTTNVDLPARGPASDGKLEPHVLLTVRDTGGGMSVETRARVFEPFFTTKEKGTGLGLSTVYGIIEQSGGRIEVDSEVGKGTTLRVFLPTDEGAVDVAPKSVRTAVTGGSETILLVEDENDLRQVTTLVLRDRGYRVLAAANAEEAALLLEEWSGPVHLLLTDVVMPGVSGPELAEHLRAAREGLRVLFVSGYADDAVLRRGVRTGVMPFLNKPFSPEALAQKVRDVLDAPVPSGPLRLFVTPSEGMPPRR